MVTKRNFVNPVFSLYAYKGLLAVSILLYHFRLRDSFYFQWQDLLFTCLDGFYLATGFIFSRSIVNNHRTFSSYCSSGHFLARSLRLLLPSFLACSLFTAISLLFYLNTSQPIITSHIILSWLISTLGLQSIYPLSSPHLYVTWFIFHDLSAFFCFAFIMHCFSRFRKPFYISAILLLFIILLILSIYTYNSPSFTFLRFLFDILLGYLTYLFFQKLPSLMLFKPHVIVFVSLVALILILLRNVFFVYLLLLLILLYHDLLLSVGPSSSRCRASVLSFLAAIGTVSLEFILVHPLVVIISNKFLLLLLRNVLYIPFPLPSLVLELLKLVLHLLLIIASVLISLKLASSLSCIVGKISSRHFFV